MRFFRARRRGFTVVELMVALIIGALVSALLMSLYRQVVKETYLVEGIDNRIAVRLVLQGRLGDDLIGIDGRNITLTDDSRQLTIAGREGPRTYVFQTSGLTRNTSPLPISGLRDLRFVLDYPNEEGKYETGGRVTNDAGSEGTADAMTDAGNDLAAKGASVKGVRIQVTFENGSTDELYAPILCSPRPVGNWVDHSPKAS